ncbi:MAG: hypothetical protein OXE58_05220 [Acidobacteria bacterium]|nr:hypothetical protein [Acidobacteriota bacterium]
MTDARLKDRLEDLVSALAAGELDQAEAQRVRARLAENPELAQLYGEIRAVRRGLANFAAGAETPPADLQGRILAATLPKFRSLYARRTHYWPTWFAAAAAAAMLLFFQPPLVRGALDSLPRASDGVSSLRAAANRQADRALAEFGVLRASVSFALEDQMDQLGDRLRDLERATRQRDELLSESESGSDPASTDDPQGDAAP